MAERHTRRVLRRLSSALLVVGGIVLAYPFWSSAYSVLHSGEIRQEYAQAVRSFSSVARAEAEKLARIRDPDRQLRHLALSFAERLREGRPLGRLQIPSIGVDEVVLEGARRPLTSVRGNDQGLLRYGPVHYGLTPLPGAGRPFAVAGHRTTYGAPFLRLGDLRRGDVIRVLTPYARLKYAVAKSTAVQPDDVTVLYDRGYDLVLTTCHPPYSARERLIVWAQLVDFELR